MISASDIDFLNAYRLVDQKQIENYARPFVVEDDDKDGLIYPRVSYSYLNYIVIHYCYLVSFKYNAITLMRSFVT